MSSDAKAWIEADGCWRALHDGLCAQPNAHTDATSYDLTSVLATVESCMRHTLRWEFRQYPDGQVGLVGYVA